MISPSYSEPCSSQGCVDKSWYSEVTGSWGGGISLTLACWRCFPPPLHSESTILGAQKAVVSPPVAQEATQLTMTRVMAERPPENSQESTTSPARRE